MFLIAIELRLKGKKMEIIGIGILFMIGVYLAPVVIGIIIVAIAGIVSFFTGK